MRGLSRRAVAAALVALCLAGCGPRSLAKKTTYPVKGTVKLGGEPVALGYVTLEPKNPGQGAECQGIIGSDGSFSISTYSNAAPDGAVPGEYYVGVSAYDPTVCGAAPKGVKPTRVPGKYGEPKASGISKVINSGNNELNIDLSPE